ncbi:MAG TPA: hypothetical protein VN758_13235 [Solirubrobacterales bacterium]|nr:hypothetical protein [Solirubrobacterales bacterium]
MRRLIKTLAVSLAGALLVPIAAQAEFGLNEFDVTFTNADGSTASQAGSHPYAMTTSFNINTHPGPPPGNKPLVDEPIKDLVIGQVPGFTGVAKNAVPRCSSADFLTEVGPGGEAAACADGSAVGIIEVHVGDRSGGQDFSAPIYNLIPSPHEAARLSFRVQGVVTTLDLGVSETPPYNVVATTNRISQVFEFQRAKVTIWGSPADPVHDGERGRCFRNNGESCPASIPVVPFLIAPRNCDGPLATGWSADSWPHPGATMPSGAPNLTDPAWATGQVLTHDAATPPAPQGFSGCGRLDFSPTISAQPTTKAAGSPTGLDFSLNVNDEGLINPNGIAAADVRKAVVTLPEGFSVNPSIAEGLEVCSEADLARETALSEAGAGCPNASKIGTVEVESPLIEENVNGALYQATPYENPFDSLVALYIVIKNPTLGIKVVQPLNVIPNPVTGQLTTVAEDLPQLPFSHFTLHFREGTRSPLASPPGCGTYNAEATLYPSSGGAALTTTSAFEIIIGPESKPCPSGGLPPFKPGLVAGTLNNAAGRYSPFNVRLFRSDSEQEITHFSIKLPPGVIGKLAGIPFCPDTAIAAAKARTGPHGGQEELDSPSCPAASQIGRTLVGSGVGSALAYAPGKLYLAGPYHGSAISLVAITAGVVGPFDIGTVVVREAFKIDPETAEVFLDATGSDPIPHIIKGIPVHLRDIRAYTDRPEFVMNPTGCERTSTASTLLGSGLDFGSEADDRPVTVSTPFQAADCAALAFKPKLSLKLKGGTARGQHPSFSATLRMKGTGESNIKRAQVTLPRSEFLEQAHIKTICTRVQFRAQACPAESIYGFAKATTPILDEPLSGPVYLRSSEHQLPDLVAELKNGQITVDLVGRVDSLNGRIRNTFEAAPDAPVKSFTLTMQGGKKGLLVNSTNICTGKHKVIADFTAHNGKIANLRPELQAKCGKSRKGSKAKSKAKHRRAG